MGDETVVSCHRVRVRDGWLEEVDGGRPVVRVPVAELVEARIARARRAERPIVQTIVGAALTAVGVIWAARVLSWLRDGGTLVVDVEIAMLAGLVVGPLGDLGGATSRDRAARRDEEDDATVDRRPREP